MSLMQEMLDEIEREAAEKSQKVLNSNGILAEAEALRDLLRRHGSNTEPYLVTEDMVVFYDRQTDGSMRRAIAASDLEIEQEIEIDKKNNEPNCRTVELRLKGLTCLIWLCNEPVALAEAA